MRIPVDYVDSAGIKSNLSFSLTRLGFVKHMAIAGQGYSPTPRKLMRCLGMLLHFVDYLQKDTFYTDRFSEPPLEISDPTEKAQFSNLAGKAIADFLSKRINQSIYTVNYEAAMRLKGIPIEGSRPDLIAFSPPSTTFSVEAKGYSGGPRDMAEHKIQSASPHAVLKVNFSIACVTYHLYSNIANNYHDPYDESAAFDKELFGKLSALYYTGLLEFLNEDFFDISETQIGSESFYEVGLTGRRFTNMFLGNSPILPLCALEILTQYQPKIILPKLIKEFAIHGLSPNQSPFRPIDGEGLYVDTDRIGLRIKTPKVAIKPKPLERRASFR